MWRPSRPKQLKQRFSNGSILSWKRFVFLRSSLRSILVWPLSALLIALVSWAALLTELENERRDAEKDALRVAEAIARGYSSQVARTVQVIDNILLHVRYEWRLSNGNLQLENINHTELFPASPVFNVGIINRNGILISNTIPALHEVNASDRRYFQVHREQSGDSLYIGEAVIGRVSKRNVVQFSRPIRDAGGSFDGVIRASVAPEYLTATYDTVSLGNRGLMAIVGSDSAVRAARIGEAVSTGIDASVKPAAILSPKARRSLFSAPNGSFFAPGENWFADNRSRYIGWQQVSGYPLLAVIGLDAEDTFAPYHQERNETIQRAAAATAVLFAFAIVATWLSVRLAWRKHQMEVTQSAYRLATEEGNEGFYICRPIADQDGAVTDFEIIDCNQTGAEFYARSREAMLGARLTHLHLKDRSDWRERLLRRLLIALEKGTFEDDIEVRTRRNRARRWFHLKITRSDGILSITTQDITKSKEHLIELERRGNEDALTSLPNRYWMTTYLPEALRRASDEQSRVALLFIDLDGFKSVNDTAGHEAGDELLRNVGLRIKQAVRPHDHVVRLGGDEFVVIVEQILDKEETAHIAERVLHAFDAQFQLSAGTFRVGTSIGISIFPLDGTDGNTLLIHADAAMYSAKTNGKNNYQFFDRQYFTEVRNRQNREAELRHALDHDQFVIYYQPRVEISTGVTCSMEALVRWIHPTKGIVGPNEFISLAEETGLIIRLGELVMDKVCAQLAFWHKSGQELVPVSINVSAKQFNDTHVATILNEALLRYGVPANLVEIELTESSMTGDSQHVTESLEALQRLGVKLAVDDFGTGYSSLSQLQRLDFDVLKVDQAFTADLVKTPEGEIFFTAIITMAHALGMRVVAEGVENLEQVKKLKALRCDEIQGFYISRPLPATTSQPVLPQHLFMK
jgi:diguanylate cyclase (GGDEF)-like protein